MKIEQLKDWAARTRSDLNPIVECLEQGNYDTAKALIKEVLQNFDELDKMVGEGAEAPSQVTGTATEADEIEENFRQGWNEGKKGTNQ